MSASGAATSLASAVRARRWGLAVVAVVGDDDEIVIVDGDDRLSESTTFQLGSITKTMTGVLLATCALRDEVALDTTVGAVHPSPGRAAHISLLDLATHRSGLPRLPPNLSHASSDPDDPYAAFDDGDLTRALQMIDPPEPGPFVYSNFGFMLLGRLLAEITGMTFAELAEERLFAPLGMCAASCSSSGSDRAPETSSRSTRASVSPGALTRTVSSCVV